MKNVFVYDFDRTLTLNDTLFGFYCCLNKQRSLIFYLKVLIYFFFAVLHRCHILSNDKLKRFGVSLFIQGLSRNFIEYKSREYSKRIELNNDLYTKAKKSHPSKLNIVISASFVDYIRPLFNDSVIILGSELNYKSGYVCGLSKNMYGDNKAFALKSLGYSTVEAVYTDSVSDLPIVKMAKNIYLVDRMFNIVICKDLIDFKSKLKAL